MVHFVGAGPGAVDLITVRGMQHIQQADVIIYAGSLVNPQLLSYAKEKAVIYDSAHMTLDEVLAVMKQAHDKHQAVVRLHTGDPSIYGAIREQMDELKKYDIPYDVCPGVSAVFGATASLQCELTLPQVTQTVILSRAQGRTPVPQKERLQSLAAHQASMALYLSSALAKQVQSELLAGGYDEKTPVAIVYKATWEDEKIFRTTLDMLAVTMEQERITKTALILVSPALGEDYAQSKLYDRHFSTEYRHAEAIKLPKQIRNILMLACSKQGYDTMLRLQKFLEEINREINVIPKVRCKQLEELSMKESVPECVQAYADHVDAMIFVCASGIAVRSVAPILRHKSCDPAILVMDEKANHIISLVSGHAGCANALTHAIADVMGAQAVITTATDVEGKYAVDAYAADHDFVITDWERAKADSVAMLQDMPLPHPVVTTPKQREEDASLQLIPKCVVAGIGCKKGISEDAIRALVEETMSQNGMRMESLCAVASIDRKKDEAGLCDFAKSCKVPFVTYSEAELAQLEGEFTKSEFVEAVTGVDNVCERSAMLHAGTLGKASMLVKKQTKEGVSLALAMVTQGQLDVVGIGPGDLCEMTEHAKNVLEQCEVIVGYQVYIDLIKPYFPDKEYMQTPMRREVQRCRMALESAAGGKRTAMICSGDAGVYGMAGIVLELAEEYPQVQIQVVPGVTAALSGGAVLGAPLGHDFAVISLSDLLTPWENIAQRIENCAKSDMAMAIYNPSSQKRADYLKRACEIILRYRTKELVCGYVRQIGRSGQEMTITTLEELTHAKVDMFTTVFIGNSQTRKIGNHMVTPRGYRR